MTSTSKIKFKTILICNYSLLAFFFILNFAGSPLLKWIYPLLVLTNIITLTFYPWQQSLITLMGLFFIEGQGRILWEYNPLARILFDVVVLIPVFQTFLKNKTIFPKKYLPSIFQVIFTLYICWYIIQFFNTDSLGPLAILAASKIYIVPLLFFFMMVQNPIQLNSYEGKHLLLMILFLLITEESLTIYQMGKNIALLQSITPTYMSKGGEIFQGLLFRPFGTTYYAGAPATYIYLTFALLFMEEKLGKIKRFVIMTLIPVSIYCLIILQVRSAMIKFILIIIGSGLVSFIVGRKRIKKLAIAFATILTVLTVVQLSNFSIESITRDLGYEESLKRFETITSGSILVASEKSGLYAGRLSTQKFLQVATEKIINNPLGLGPGHNGAALSISLDKVLDDPIYGIDASWNFENLIISYIIDLGIGFIFITSFIFGIVILLLLMALRSFFDGNIHITKTIGISLVVLTVILIGNWAAVGLPYNPESFIFWLFASIGISSFNAHYGKFTWKKQ